MAHPGLHREVMGSREGGGAWDSAFIGVEGGSLGFHWLFLYW